MEIKFEQVYEVNKETILVDVANRYGIHFHDLKFIGGFDSFVHEFTNNQGSFIIKIMDSSRRTVKMVLSEIDYINYLFDHGVSVSKGVASVNGKYVEELWINDSLFIIVAYEKANGKLPEEKDWDDQLFKKWGSVLGKIHNLSKMYRPTKGIIKRREWNELDFFQFNKHIPQSDELVYVTIKKLMERINDLDKEIDGYGLVHGDFHHMNYFIHDGEITVFDFDDLHYNWYVYDIACILYYAHRRVLRNHDNYTEYFYKNFMQGYSEYNQLDEKWLEEIGTFLKLRHVISYVILNQIVDINNMNADLKSFYNSIKNDIELNKDIIKYNFKNLR